MDNSIVVPQHNTQVLGLRHSNESLSPGVGNGPAAQSPRHCQLRLDLGLMLSVAVACVTHLLTLFNPELRFLVYGALGVVVDDKVTVCVADVVVGSGELLLARHLQPSIATIASRVAGSAS